MTAHASSHGLVIASGSGLVAVILVLIAAIVLQRSCAARVLAGACALAGASMPWWLPGRLVPESWWPLTLTALPALVAGGLVIGMTRMPQPLHGRRFELHRGDELLGTIELRAELSDFPWYGGLFDAAPAFDAVAHLFRQELELLGREDMDAWGAVLAQIEGPGLRLVPSGGGAPVPDLFLHIDGTQARWRA